MIKKTKTLEAVFQRSLVTWSFSGIEPCEEIIYDSFKGT